MGPQDQASHCCCGQLQISIHHQVMFGWVTKPGIGEIAAAPDVEDATDHDRAACHFGGFSVLFRGSPSRIRPSEDLAITYDVIDVSLRLRG